VYVLIADTGMELQKWSKGKVREKLNNMVVFDQNTYDRMMKEVGPSHISLSLNSHMAKVLFHMIVSHDGVHLFLVCLGCLGHDNTLL